MNVLMNIYIFTELQVIYVIKYRQGVCEAIKIKFLMLFCALMNGLLTSIISRYPEEKGTIFFKDTPFYLIFHLFEMLSEYLYMFY